MAVIRAAGTVAFLRAVLPAAGRQAARRAEAVPVEASAEALPEADILRPDTAAITNLIFAPFHPTPHSPSGGSEGSLLPTSNVQVEREKNNSRDAGQLMQDVANAVRNLGV